MLAPSKAAADAAAPSAGWRATEITADLGCRLDRRSYLFGKAVAGFDLVAFDTSLRPWQIRDRSGSHVAWLGAIGRAFER